MTKEKDKEKIIKEKVEKQPLTCTQCHAVYKPTKDDASCPMFMFQQKKKDKY